MICLSYWTEYIAYKSNEMSLRVNLSYDSLLYKFGYSLAAFALACGIYE